MQAFVRFHQGRLAEADELSSGLLDEAEERGDPWAIGMMLGLQASLRLWTGRVQDAIPPAEEAVRRFRAMGDWYGQLLGLGVLGRALVSLGRFEDAWEVLDESLAVAAEVRSPEAQLIAHTTAVTAAAQAGRPDRVESPLPDWEPRESVAEVGLHDFTIAAALVDLQRGQVGAARQVLEDAVATLGESANGYSWSSLALARAADGDVEGARSAATTASAIASATFADRVAAATVRLLAAARAGDEPAAAAALAEARAELEATDDRLGRALLSLAAAHADAALDRQAAPAAPVAADEVVADSPGWDTAYRLAAGLPVS
jgi:hypothetical protein